MQPSCLCYDTCKRHDVRIWFSNLYCSSTRNINLLEMNRRRNNWQWRCYHVVERHLWLENEKQSKSVISLPINLPDYPLPDEEGWGWEGGPLFQMLGNPTLQQCQFWFLWLQNLMTICPKHFIDIEGKSFSSIFKANLLICRSRWQNQFQ